MAISAKQLNEWLRVEENEHLEFKEAKQRFDFDELVKYCVALSNEGGGYIVMGVNDERPRRIVGSQAFEDIGRTKAGLTDRLRIRIEAEEIYHPHGRVLVFSVPPRPIGLPMQYRGAYWMRSGDSLVPMTNDYLQLIFREGEVDFSGEISAKATLSDLDSGAIQLFRTMWSRKSGNVALLSMSDTQLLADAELVVDGGITYAALILFGTHRALGRHLAQAEVIFEYRSNEASGPAQQREEYRQGFFLFLDEIWNKVNLRNDLQHFQYNFFMLNVPTFNEVVVREAVLNAISHRDYRLAGSVFVRQFPRRFEVVSPGGLLPGITPENILWRHAPRNRRIAESFARCGLVERAGQGMNRIYEACIKESKAYPDFTGTDDFQVSFIYHGDVQDPQFLRFLEKVGLETLTTFTTEDLLVLNYVYREQPLPAFLKQHTTTLLDNGIIERIGQGRGSRYMLSRRFYEFINKKGLYTRKRGLDRETNKALLLKHIRDNKNDGTQFQELIEVLPALSRDQIQKLLREMKIEGQIYNIGGTSAARWYPVETTVE